MSGAAAFRVVQADERAAALALWQTVFDLPPGFFERYFSPADPFFQDGDTLGAWHAGRLVSAVHICRRRLIWGGGTLLCGAIANVATLPEARRQGLSRHLLTLALDTMQRERFDFSLLGTGVPGHYAALGWKTAASPCFTLQPHSDFVAVQWQPLAVTDALRTMADAVPRPLQFVRPRPYWENWVAGILRQEPTVMILHPERGCLLLSVPDATDRSLFAPEWHAVDAASEQELLQAAAGEAFRLGRPLILAARPQHLPADFLDTLGTVTVQMDTGPMTRNITLPEETYRQILAAYHSGAAVWWAGDRF